MTEGLLSFAPIMVSVFSALIAVYVALRNSLALGWMNIRASRQNARQQATLDFMNKYNDSDKMTKGILAIRAIDTYIEKVENANSCEDTIKIRA